MNTQTKATPQEVQQILKDYNYDFKAIYQNEELRDKVNLLGFDFEGAKKIARENQSIEFLELSDNPV